MGKIEDMRRLREQQFARTSSANDDKSGAKKASTASATTASATTASATAASGTADEGKCPTCGKVKPLSNGLLANHQKGFGKACAGSRKEPA
jgi:hypothetical protein